jgi:long-subunit fatty acid transport protein
MKKLILTLIATAGLTAYSFGQYVDQALIFSQQNFGSTARSKAMGNAFGAIGGDFSSLSINPAGIGIYLKSEVSTTLNVVGMNNSETTYRGQITDDRSNDFSFRNFGYVLATPVKGGGSSGLVSFNIGIGFNRLNNFNQTISVSKNSSPYSRMDAFAQNTKNVSRNDLLTDTNYDPYYNSNVPWESEMAWQNYLIDPVPNSTDNSYQSILLQNELVNQNLTINKTGFLNEYVASIGANFNHQFYIGATFGMQDLYYNVSQTYSEDGEFGRFDYINSSRTRGYGYNLKFGIIYRPAPSLRLGAAIHTPTFFDLKEDYSSTMSSNLTNVSTEANGTHTALTPLGDYRYNLDTPLRAIGSAALQFGKKGLLSFDYEYVDYSKMNLRNGGNGYGFSNENTDITTIYRPVTNLRFGGEFKPTQALSFRAGYELFGNPYHSFINNVSQPNKDFNCSSLNAGIGFRVDNVSLDLSYSLTNRTDYNYIDNIDSEPVKNHMSNNEIVLTLGIRL